MCGRGILCKGAVMKRNSVLLHLIVLALFILKCQKQFYYVNLLSCTEEKHLSFVRTVQKHYLVVS